jgi:hypothetical protein
MLCHFAVVIPEFEGSGLLPVGVHWADMTEVDQRYGHNGHRRLLLAGLKRARIALRAAGCQIMYLDGSFITAKEFPGDYDVCWEMAGVKHAALDPVFLDFTNRRAAQKAKFLGEFFPAHIRAESAPPFRAFIDFFQTDKDSGSSKGIIGIQLKGSP